MRNPGSPRPVAPALAQKLIVLRLLGGGRRPRVNFGVAGQRSRHFGGGLGAGRRPELSNALRRRFLHGRIVDPADLLAEGGRE